MGSIVRWMIDQSVYSHPQAVTVTQTVLAEPEPSGQTPEGAAVTAGAETETV